MPNMNNNSDQELTVDGVSMRPFGLTRSVVYATDSTTTTTTGNTNEEITVLYNPEPLRSEAQQDVLSQFVSQQYAQLERDLFRLFSLDSTEKRAKKKPKLTYAKFEWK